MMDISFIGIFVTILAVGIISFLWVTKGMMVITDPLIRKLFKYIQALIITLLAVSIIFITWTSFSSQIQINDESLSGPIVYIFLISISALMLGSSLAVKRIATEYGFKVKTNDKNGETVKTKSGN
jgi:hypothetical protein